MSEYVQRFYESKKMCPIVSILKLQCNNSWLVAAGFPLLGVTTATQLVVPVELLMQYSHTFLANFIHRGVGGYI